ncbi:hypothetical protein I7I53_04504 [Histoplasma capsulatum var. duboisii H88]|uniref:Uncharacterized protein n=1 Tax=Ajellomyces capsulatus (strain H88) TaxID=544711 RepID=A0A8A1LUS1_AJEC8|nr:hypothetical protein I7I53_04504 [Histoplasma capsulatum var. duboisii H88]
MIGLKGQSPCCCATKQQTADGQFRRQYCICAHGIYGQLQPWSNYSIGLPFARNFAPNFHKINGEGRPSPRKTNAKTLCPHPYPSRAKSAGANSGNTNAKMLRKNWLAAVADAI